MQHEHNEHKHNEDHELAQCRARYAADHRLDTCGHESGTACETATGCPDSMQLARLAQNRVWWLTRKRLRSHLSNCSACADDYRVMRQASADIRDALGSQPSGHSVVLQWLFPLRDQGLTGMRPLLLTAALVLGLSTLLLVPMDADHHMNDDAMLATSAAGSSAVVLAQADDVLFRSDFDTAQTPSESEPARRQDLFADGFGG